MRVRGGVGVLGGWSVSLRVTSLLLCRVQTDLSWTQKHTRVNSAKVCGGGKKRSYGGMDTLPGIAPRKDRRSLVV